MNISYVRCKRWIIFSEGECSFSFKEARIKECECGICKLGMKIESERRKRMELNNEMRIW